MIDQSITWSFQTPVNPLRQQRIALRTSPSVINRGAGRFWPHSPAFCYYAPGPFRQLVFGVDWTDQSGPPAG